MLFRLIIAVLDRKASPVSFFDQFQQRVVLVIYEALHFVNVNTCTPLKISNGNIFVISCGLKVR